MLDDDEDRCYSRGDQWHDYGRCRLPLGHDEAHTDDEGYVW